MKQYVAKSLLIITLVFFSINLSAQQAKLVIHGKVTSKSDNQPLIGVSVTEYDASNRILNGTVTDFDGNYTLGVSGSKESQLVFSYIGYAKLTKSVGSSSTLNVQLEDGSQALKEVSVIARKQTSTGVMNINERDLTFATSKVDTKDLEGLQVASIDEALQGRMAGVDIVANSGEPGAGMSIRIRGTTSINNGSDPLIVVDGIPFDTKVGSDFDFASADEENYAQLLNISPADIQEISVLKDAAACAMYGNRGANGVLIIKTKRGTMSKPMVNYTMKGSLNTPAEPISMLNGNQYASLVLDAAQNAGTPLSTVSYPQFTYDPQNPYYYYNYGQNTNWYEALTRNGHTQDHSLALSGGGEKLMYRASVGYYDQTGTVIGQAYSRLTGSLNLDYNVSDKLKFQIGLSYTHGNQDKNYTTDILSSAFTKMPNMSIYEFLPNTDGTYTLSSNYFSPVTTPQGYWSSTSNSGVYNPVAMASTGYWNVKSERIIPKFNLQYWIMPEVLKLQTDIAFDINISKENKFLPQIATGRLWPELSVNRATDYMLGNFVVQTFNKLYYTPKLGEDHDLIGLLQFSTYDSKSSSYQGVSALGASTFLQDPSIPANMVGSGLGLSSGSSEARSISALAMLQYKFLDRYIINVTMRQDGDSKYSLSQRYGYFPSVSLRWRASNEPFLASVETINDLSFRLSTGKSGNPVSKNYLFQNMYGTYDWTYNGEQGVYSTNLQLSNLKWEKVTDVNVGGNLIMLDNRLNLDYNWYKKRTSDLYFPNVGISSVTGFSSANQNVGTMDNRGWELSIISQPVRTKNWQVDFNMTFSRSENEIMELSDNIPLISTPTAANGKYLTKLQIGNPIGSFYGYIYDGVYLNDAQTIAKDKKGNPIYAKDDEGNKVPIKMKFWYPSVAYEFQAGDAKYRDINHDGNINSLDIVYLGNFNPLLTGGFGPTIRYKKSLSLTAYFYFRYGFDVINQTRMDMESMYNFNNQSTAVLRRWTQTYDDATTAPADLLPRALMKKGYNWLGSSRFVEDGSFLRFKSITLNYYFDKEIVKKIGLTDAKIWATVQNIYLWSKYTGMDPEVTLKSGISELGYDTSRSGRPQEFSIGLSASF